MTESTGRADLGRIMGMIQKLLVQADHPNTSETEAATYRAKAEQLMRDYRVQEEELIATTPDAATPQLHRIWLGVATGGVHRGAQKADGSSRSRQTTFFQQWFQLLSAACWHAGAENTYEWGTNPDSREYGIFGLLVGYEGDLRLAEMLYTSARMVFSERVEPRYDPSLSEAENIYRLRSAGITRRRVAQMVYDLDTHAAHARVGEIYKAECRRRGEEPALDGRGISADGYRDAYAQAFCDQFARRLRQARDAADRDGGAIQLHGREERVREAFWNFFPHLRPKPASEVAQASKVPARRVRMRKMSAADERRLYSEAARAGRAAGKAAADTVDINRPAPTGRVEASKRQPAGEI